MSENEGYNKEGELVYNLLTSADLCSDACGWVRNKSIAEAWAECNNSHWMAAAIEILAIRGGDEYYRRACIAVARECLEILMEETGFRHPRFVFVSGEMGKIIDKGGLSVPMLKDIVHQTHTQMKKIENWEVKFPFLYDQTLDQFKLYFKRLNKMLSFSAEEPLEWITINTVGLMALRREETDHATRAKKATESLADYIREIVESPTVDTIENALRRSEVHQLRGMLDVGK
jgi:hypothetical protein